MQTMVKARNRTKVNIPICLAAVLLCLTLLSIHMTSGLYARYSSSDAGEDASRVAKFEITKNKEHISEQLVLSLAPGTMVSEIEVYNKSEVSVAYTLNVENVSKNLPLQFQIDEEPPSANSILKEKEMPPDTMYQYKFSVIWPKENALQDMGKVDLIQITIDAVQID